MSTDSFTTTIRGFDVTVEIGEAVDTYTVHVVEGSGVPWTVELPINLENFEGQDEDDVDGSNELLTLVAEAAVDLFESSRDTLGQGAGALEVAAMKKAQTTITACGSEWQDYYLQLKGTTFEGKAEELVRQWLDLMLHEPEWEDKNQDLRKEKQQLIYELNLLELELLKNSPEQQMLIIMAGRKRAYLNDIEIPLYLDIFAGSPQESEAVNIMKGILDIDERIQQVDSSNEGWDDHWKQLNSIEMQLQDLILTSVQEHAIHAPAGAAGAPNMANDIAELMEGVDLHAPLSARKRAQQIRTEGMWDYTEEFQMSNPLTEGMTLRLRKPHDESWIEAARHSMCVLESYDPKMNEQRGRGSDWVDLQTIRTDDIDYLPPEYVALFDSEMPPSIFDEDEVDPAFKTSRRAFEETETAEEREIEGGEIRHDLDTGCIDPEDYKFEPNQKVTLNKKLELMIGGGVPKDYAKGTPCVVESRYDGEGDFYYVRFEDGQMARVLFSDLAGGKKKESSFYGYMEGLLKTAYDRRRDTSKWYDSLDTGKQIAYINLNVDDEEEVPLEVRDFMDVSEGGELSIAVPFVWGVCDTCEGRRKVVNPSIDEHGISPEEFQDDPDFEESYFSGAYDITCPGCGGDGLVPEPNYGNNTALENFVESMLQEKAGWESEWRHEREMGY